jgi:hypothetical protein
MVSVWYVTKNMQYLQISKNGNEDARVESIPKATDRK